MDSSMIATNKKKSKRKGDVQCEKIPQKPYSRLDMKVITEDDGDERQSLVMRNDVKKSKKRDRKAAKEKEASISSGEGGGVNEEGSCISPKGLPKRSYLDMENMMIIEDDSDGTHSLVMRNDVKKSKKKKKKNVANDEEANISLGVGGSLNVEGDQVPPFLEDKKKSKKRKLDQVDQLSSSSNGNPQKSNVKGQVAEDGKFGQINSFLDESKSKKKKASQCSDANISTKVISDIEVDRKLSKAKTSEEKDSNTSKKPKRVSFSGHVEVFPLDEECAGSNLPKDHTKDGLIRGKRFTKEENEKIKEAVYEYIKVHNLGKEGLHMILHSNSYREVRGCWDEIAAALPWRPKTSVYLRTHIIFRRGEKRHWDPEEIEFIKRQVEEHGFKWTEIADVLGRHKIHVKDAWRRNRLQNTKSGHWSQDEYQKLFDLVNMDLRMKVAEEKNTKHGLIRDNISWDAISAKLATRSHPRCCMKWYHQLRSPMVVEGLWADSDDYRLIDVLLKLDACCAEDVDWDHLLEHRSGEQCRKRWNEMSRSIGGYREKTFMEQVDVLSGRYCPEMLQYTTATEEEE